MKVNSCDRLILCQPDNKKGCSLCCGLFNFRDISRTFLRDFLTEGNTRSISMPTYRDYICSFSIRDESSHICPYQGFLSENKPGCLIHPLSSGAEGRGRSMFESKICGDFFCPAHEILTEREKFFLSGNITDWYLYSTAIADPESFSFIYNYVSDRLSESQTPERACKPVSAGLAAHAINLSEYEGAVFCYSVPEYNLNKENFSVRYNTVFRNRVIDCIDENLIK